DTTLRISRRCEIDRRRRRSAALLPGTHRLFAAGWRCGDRQWPRDPAGRRGRPESERLADAEGSRRLPLDPRRWSELLAVPHQRGSRVVPGQMEVTEERPEGTERRNGVDFVGRFGL